MFRRFASSVLFCSVLFCSVEGAEYAYVTNYDANYPAVSQVDLSTLQVVKNFNLNAGNLPHPTSSLGSIAITPDYKYLFVCNLEEGKGKIVSKIEISSGKITNIYNDDFRGPRSVAITPDGKFALVTSINNNRIAIINVVTNAVDFIENDSGYLIVLPVGIAVTPDGKKAFVSTQSGGSVFVLDLITKKIVNAINSPSFELSFSIAISPNGLNAYVSNLFKNIVSVIDVIGEKWLYDIEGFDGPDAIAISPSGTKAYISQSLEDFTETIYALDLTQGEKAKPQPISLGEEVSGADLAFNASGSKVFVSSGVIGKVFQINAQTNAVEGFVSGFPGKPNRIAITPLPYLIPTDLPTIEKAFSKFTPIKFQR